MTWATLFFFSILTRLNCFHSFNKNATVCSAPKHYLLMLIAEMWERNTYTYLSLLIFMTARCRAFIWYFFIFVHLLSSSLFIAISTCTYRLFYFASMCLCASHWIEINLNAPFLGRYTHFSYFSTYCPISSSCFVKKNTANDPHRSYCNWRIRT